MRRRSRPARAAKGRAEEPGRQRLRQKGSSTNDRKPAGHGEWNERGSEGIGATLALEPRQQRQGRHEHGSAEHFDRREHDQEGGRQLSRRRRAEERRHDQLVDVPGREGDGRQGRDGPPLAQEVPGQIEVDGKRRPPARRSQREPIAHGADQARRQPGRVHAPEPASRGEGTGSPRAISRAEWAGAATAGTRMRSAATSWLWHMFPKTSTSSETAAKASRVRSSTAYPRLQARVDKGAVGRDRQWRLQAERGGEIAICLSAAPPPRRG